MSVDAAKQEPINLAELPLSQLHQVKAQLEEEINHFTSSYTKLKQAQTTFTDCKNNLKEINEGNQDKTILIPLTSSLYVPGKLRDVEKVLLDVGTGYYVEKSVKSAQTFYNDKVNLIQGNLKSLQDTVTAKQSNLNGKHGCVFFF
ncbi:subunit of tubulin prefoldin, variant 2 [Entomophthora muscae]|uniref:Subunit of tubulin prefoldin, variant 2 n=1 Tax=Entomophthora muscae TaxID=34485 RepID=A0ACC2UT93_9FUNG|nr:subunit of tubulin prefoldin, variant 2 [Entomophthora muscae]